jgi:hypothetical protein
MDEDRGINEQVRKQLLITSIMIIHQYVILEHENIK